MKLISLSVENFGVLHSETFACEEGLNVFCRENGAGKTTLAAFLCAMLYGLPASRKSDLAENERKKYLPWQGGPFGGSMTFSVGEKTYRVERYFSDGASAKRDSFVLYDLADNSISHDYSENLGMELFGLDAAAFERSAYLPQRALTGKGGNESISALLSRAIDGGAENEDTDPYQTAAALLDKQRQYYVRHGGRGYISELEEKLSALHEKEYSALQAKRDADRYSGEAQVLRTELSAHAKDKQRLTDSLGDAQIRSAVFAHGRSLVEYRDTQLSAAAQIRQFLHLDDADGIAGGRYGEEAVFAAEQNVREGTRLRDRLELTEEVIARTGEEQARIAALFRNGIPDAGVLQNLAFSVQMLKEIPAEQAGGPVRCPHAFPRRSCSVIPDRR